MATTSTKNVTGRRNRRSLKIRENKGWRKRQNTSKNAKEGSLASKANLVSRYNSSNSKKSDVEPYDKRKGRIRK